MRAHAALGIASLLLAMLVGCRRGGSPAPGGTATSAPVPPVALDGHGGGPVAGLDPRAARERRDHLVEDLVAFGYLHDPRVIAAMHDVPRHLFMPGASLSDAYEDVPYPIGQGQTISQPAVVALMTEALEVGPTDRVLEIGTGSGYQAAILSKLAAEVFTIEIIPELGTEASERLSRLGYDNVRVRVGDGYLGWPEASPFDRIIVTAAPPEIPQALTAQLADHGVLVAPIGESWQVQRLVRVRKIDGTLRREDLGAVAFVPMVPGK